MGRNHVLLGIGFAVVGAVSALAVVLVTWDRGEEKSATRPVASEDSSGIEARATLSPRIALFGDTVRAYVDVTLDKTRVDPDSVRVVADFSPWEVVGKPQRGRRGTGDTVYLRTTFVLRCLTGACVPPGSSAPLEFNPARIFFTAPSEQSADQSSIRRSWPLLLVYSRFAAANLEDRQALSVPWQADLVSLPAASYRMAPGILIGVLLSGAGLALTVAIGLAYVAWPSRAPAPPLEPEPELPLEPVLSPLEQALALLEDSARVDGAADKRRALELVAEELELAEWGDADLAHAARALAWSEDIPTVDETTGLAARVRSALPEIEGDRDNGDGHVV